MQSVGLIPKHLPFSGSNNAILYFRHALALDERRVKFIPSFCTNGKSKGQRVESTVSDHSKGVSENSHHKVERRQLSGKSYEYETHVNSMSGRETDVEEVFFAGAHCGMFQSFHAHRIRYLWTPFQTLGVDLWQTASVTVSLAFPSDG